MNWLQRLLGIDKLIEALGSGNNQEVEKLKQHIQFQEKQLQEQNERERQLREKLQRQLQSQSQEQKPDVRDVLIKQLEENQKHLEEKLKAAQLVKMSPKDALAEYFKAQNQVEETKRKPGRPCIEGKRFNMILELDIAIILEEVARSQKKSLAKLINETMRNYLYDSYSELFEDLNKPQDADDPRQMHFEFGQED